MRHSHATTTASRPRRSLLVKALRAMVGERDERFDPAEGRKTLLVFALGIPMLVCIGFVGAFLAELDMRWRHERNAPAIQEYYAQCAENGMSPAMASIVSRIEPIER